MLSASLPLSVPLFSSLRIKMPGDGNVPKTPGLLHSYFANSERGDSTRSSEAREGVWSARVTRPGMVGLCPWISTRTTRREEPVLVSVETGKGCKTDRDARGYFTGIRKAEDSNCFFPGSSNTPDTTISTSGPFPPQCRLPAGSRLWESVTHPDSGRLPPASYKSQPGYEAWAVAVGTQSDTGCSWAGAAESKGLGPGLILLSDGSME